MLRCVLDLASPFYEAESKAGGHLAQYLMSRGSRIRDDVLQSLAGQRASRRGYGLALGTGEGPRRTAVFGLEGVLSRAGLGIGRNIGGSPPAVEYDHVADEMDFSFIIRVQRRRGWSRRR